MPNKTQRHLIGQRKSTNRTNGSVGSVQFKCRHGTESEVPKWQGHAKRGLSIVCANQLGCHRPNAKQKKPNQFPFSLWPWSRHRRQSTKVREFVRATPTTSKANSCDYGENRGMCAVCISGAYRDLRLMIKANWRQAHAGCREQVLDFQPIMPPG